MHAGNLSTSPRLRATLAALSASEWRTTWEIAQQTRSCAVHSDIAGLRANGVGVETRGPDTRNGQRVYSYRLKGAEPRQQELGP